MFIHLCMLLIYSYKKLPTRYLIDFIFPKSVYDKIEIGKHQWEFYFLGCFKICFISDESFSA